MVDQLTLFGAPEPVSPPAPALAKHTCHADGCDCQIDPKFFMCKKHWYMVPENLRTAIWNHYRPGQEHDKQPSALYLDAARRAKEAVRAAEAAAKIDQDKPHVWAVDDMAVPKEGEGWARPVHCDRIVKITELKDAEPDYVWAKPVELSKQVEGCPSIRYPKACLILMAPAEQKES